MAQVYEVEHLTKVFWRGRESVLANDDVSLALEGGEILGLLGESRSGKTTLVRQLLGLLEPTSGRIRLDAQDLDVAAAAGLLSQRVGYLAQHLSGAEDLTVWQAVYFTAHAHGLSRADARRETDRLVEEWQLGDQRSHAIRRLSGRQQRLVGIAITLAARRSVLILDQPTSGLDAADRYRVWETLLRLNRQMGTTILLVSDDLLEVERLGQRVALMRHGRLLAVDQLDALKARLAQAVQLEVALAPSGAADGSPRRLQGLWSGPVRPAGPDRWALTVSREEVTEVVPRLLAHLGGEALEDLRLQTYSLEGFYLAFDAIDRSGGATERLPRALRAAGGVGAAGLAGAAGPVGGEISHVR